MSETRRAPSGCSTDEAPVSERKAAVRLGGIDYLNALPLLWGLEEPGDPPISLRMHPPSELALLLRGGELDGALLPVVAYLDDSRYRIVPGIAISSYGAVESIRLYHRVPLENVKRLGADRSSRTSVLLARLLFRRRWGGDPALETSSPEDLLAVLKGEETRGTPDALLLIGDAALAAGEPEGWDRVDLGSEWTAWSGLPFVYAFWAVRPAADRELLEGLTARLQRARREGFARIDDIIGALEASGRLPPSMDRAHALRYLSRVIDYDLDEEKFRALETFFRMLEEAGLIVEAPARLRFLAERGKTA